MKHRVINIKQKFQLFQDQWSPKIIAQMNDYHFKIAKIQGNFIMHSHPDTDETFMVISGNMKIEFEREIVELSTGEMIIVPKGVLHKPIAEHECQILMIEPVGTLNTGDAESDRKITELGWI